MQVSQAKDIRTNPSGSALEEGHDSAIARTKLMEGMSLDRAAKRRLDVEGTDHEMSFKRPCTKTHPVIEIDSDGESEKRVVAPSHQVNHHHSHHHHAVFVQPHSASRAQQHRQAQITKEYPKIKRGAYTCSRCGESKKGHVCTLKLIHHSAEPHAYSPAQRAYEERMFHQYGIKSEFAAPGSVQDYMHQHHQQVGRVRLLSHLQVLEETKDYLLQQNVQLKILLQNYEMAQRLQMSHHSRQPFAHQHQTQSDQREVEEFLQRNYESRRLNDTHDDIKNCFTTPGDAGATKDPSDDKREVKVKAESDSPTHKRKGRHSWSKKNYQTIVEF
eukprot:TRINITY_DN1429_c1_g1_i1.p1 TRINITY_DN1429_c1_g1~~TRINITY_DN1429_c1_g1_i1.p1  ORF type:complete len:382 (-),score=80.55 TRINITY_DN1429_c1_g1_i1:177-1163(-)